MMSDLSNSHVSRRNFLRGAALAGTGLSALLLSPVGASLAAPSMLTSGDTDILIAAEIAEALAVTTYTGIIRRAPFF